MEGHNYSNGNSDGEDDDGSEKNPAQTGQGCYKNYEHFPTARKTSSALKPSQVSSNEKKSFAYFIYLQLLLLLVRHENRTTAGFTSIKVF